MDELVDVCEVPTANRFHDGHYQQNE